jgi:AAA ATPase-like protein
VLIGRGRELAQLRGFLAACEDGPCALMIEGEAGIGKTALFDAAVCDASGLCVLRVRCVDAESRLAYAGLADLLGERASAATAALPPPQRRALEVALLRADPAGELVEPHAVGRAVVGVLRLLVGQAPVLIAIDDAQWLDAASAGALAFALRRLDGVRLGLLATWRATDGRPPLGPDEVMPAARWHRLVLGPLHEDDLGELLDQRFPRPPRRSLRSRVIAVAAGNPLYAIELMAAHGTSVTSVEDSLKLPPRLEELLAGRLERLPDEAAEPLAAVASLAAPTVALVVAALGADARAGLAYALDDNILQVSEGRLQFSHPLLAVAALDRLAPSVRRALHGRLAASVADDEERGRHLVLSADGPDAETAAGAERAADLARARGAPEAAGLLAEAAIRLTPPGRTADLLRRRVAAGYHWVTAGEISRGRAHMAAAVDAAPQGPGRAELQWRLGMLAHLDGDLGQAIRLLETARAGAGEDHGPAVEATRRLAGLYGLQGRMGDSVRCWRSALDAARVAGDRRAELETLCYGHSAVLVGAVTAAELRDRVERLAGVAGSFAPHEDPVAFLAWLHMLMGQPAAAAGSLERLYQRAAEQGEEIGQAAVSALLAQAELAAGNWERARQLAREARNAGRHAAIARSFGTDFHVASLVEAHLGNLDQARAAATALVELAAHRGLVPLLWQGRAVLGFCIAVQRGRSRRSRPVRFRDRQPAATRGPGMGLGLPSVV